MIINGLDRTCDTCTCVVFREAPYSSAQLICICRGTRSSAPSGLRTNSLLFNLMPTCSLDLYMSAKTFPTSSLRAGGATLSGSLHNTTRPDSVITPIHSTRFAVSKMHS